MNISPRLTIASARHHLFFRSLVVLTALGLLSLGGALTASAQNRLEGEVDGFVKSLRAQGKIRGDERTAWLAYDLTSRETLVSINENAQLQAASMIKPFLALAFFHQVEAGQISYGPESRSKLDLMIQKSDNDATNWVMQRTGGPAATQALLKRHYSSICQQISIVEFIPAGGRTYRNKASAGDYGRFLEALWARQLPQSEEILRSMALPGMDRLYTDAKNVPSGTRVFNKTGSTSMCCGDMGILVARGRDGRSYPYMIIGVIESARNNSNNYGSWISNRADVIREVSNLVYLGMKQRHPL